MSTLDLLFPSGRTFTLEGVSVHHLEDVPVLEADFIRSGLDQDEWELLDKELNGKKPLPQWSLGPQDFNTESAVNAGLDGILRIKSVGGQDYTLPAQRYEA